MDTPAVHLRALTRAYGSVRAVDGIDLRIERGEKVALLGPNGAGKSTTINMLLGLIPPDTGAVELFGRSPAKAVRSGQVGAMLQEGGLVPRLTVRELINFARGTYQNPLPFDEVVAIARLGEILNRRVDKLSGGQAQRTRVALALCGSPDLVVLDEPTAALDVESRRELWAALTEYAAKGRTVLFSTHYLEEADDYADRVVVIAHGRVIADGTSSEIKSVISGRTVSVDVQDGREAGLDLLPGVISVQMRGNRAIMQSTDSDATVLALALAEMVCNLEVSSTGLEDAFVALTSDVALAGDAAFTSDPVLTSDTAATAGNEA